MEAPAVGNKVTTVEQKSTTKETPTQQQSQRLNALLFYGSIAWLTQLALDVKDMPINVAEVTWKGWVELVIGPVLAGLTAVKAFLSKSS